MQLALNQLDAQLGKGLRALYTLHGNEPLLEQEALDSIRRHARAQGYSERSSFTVSGAHFDWSAVLAAGSSLSLFADKQIVEVRIPSGKPGKEGALALQQLAQQAVGNDSTLTLVMLPRLDKTSKSSAWFTALDNHGATLQLDPVTRTQLPAWIAQTWRPRASAWRQAKQASARCSFLPTVWKATCWQRTKKFKSSPCSTRRAN